MKFPECISKYQVFTTPELMSAMDSPASAEGQPRLAVRRGSIERVRRGLLVSYCGRYVGAPVDVGGRLGGFLDRLGNLTPTGRPSHLERHYALWGHAGRQRKMLLRHPELEPATTHDCAQPRGGLCFLPPWRASYL
jgi:hypothetical protein